MKPNIIFQVSEQYIAGQTGVFSIEINAPIDYVGEVVSMGEFEKLDNVEVIELFNKEEASWETLPNGLNYLTDTPFSPIEQVFTFRVKFKTIENTALDFKLVNSEDMLTIVAEAQTNFQVVQEGTPYMEIYELFLNTITDERIASLTIEEIEEELLPLLKKSIFYLCRIAKEADFDLHLRDDSKQIFLQKLTEHEKVVLAFAMVVCWTEQQLNSTRFINQQYYDAGIKTYSPNETMKNLLALNDNYSLKLKNKLTEYNYKVVDVSRFGGNE